MQGLGIATRDADDVTGKISLKRVASKITLNLKLPEYIDAKVYDTEGNDTGKTERWSPKFDEPGNPSAGISDVWVDFQNVTA